MTRYCADLHIHSVLSPCADPEMTPAAIVRQAILRGLSIIAICDHNAAENAGAARRAAARADLTVLPGIEIETREEVHVLGLFPTVDAAEKVSHDVRDTLPPFENPPKWMGDQSVMTASGKVVRTESKMLGAASSFAIGRAVDLIHDQGGIAIAAHVDRPSYSVISQLGFLPEGVDFDALEISAAGLDRGRAKDFENNGLPLVASSDSHYLSDIGSACTFFELDEPTFSEVRLALRGISGRRCALA